MSDTLESHPYEGTLEACPFCGEIEELEIANTWTLSYWIECPCGCEIHDPDNHVEWENLEEAHSVEKHLEAHQIAIDKWNQRPIEGS